MTATAPAFTRDAVVFTEGDILRDVLVEADAVRSVHHRLPDGPVGRELAEIMGLLPHLTATGKVRLA